MEIAVSSFIHIMNFILEQLESIITHNLILAIIREQASDLFVVDYFRVDELRFWKSSEKAKKCSDIMSQIHFKILGKIVDLYSTGFFPERTEYQLFDFFHDIAM